MFPLLVIVAIGGIIAAVAGASRGAASPKSNVLISGHRYKVTMRTDVRRAGATFAQMETLTTRLAALGWTSVFLEPVETEIDPFVWDFDAIWSGSLTKLADGQGLFFITVPEDVTVRADHHGKYDDDLPPDLEETVTRMLGFESDPIKLFDFAQQLRPQFPIAAGALETKAATLNFGPGNLPSPPAPPPPGPPPPPPPGPVKPQTPPFVPVTPVIVPPAPPPPSPPPAPPAPPPQPDQPEFVQFDPGPLPRLPAIPPAGGNKTPAHASVQRALNNFYENTNVVDPLMNGDNFNFTTNDVDGILGPFTQRALWGFQRYQNKTNNFALTEDGLPGAQTNAVLVQWGFDPNASTSPVTFIENNS